MAVDNFIPEVWAAQLLVALNEEYVLAAPQSINRDYEGEIANGGDTVHIGSLTRPTISDYVKNVTVINPQPLTTTDQVVVIDQSKYFAFEVDDVDARQAKNGGALLNTAAREAAIGLQEVSDTFVGTLMVTQAGTALPNMAATTPEAAYNTLIRLKVGLDKRKVPAQGRWVAVSPDLYALLLLDKRFIDASASGSTAALTNGLVGRAAGFDVRMSLNLPQGQLGDGPEPSSFIISGHKIATTFADQISKTEAYRPHSSFSDAVKGLHLYGGKVVRPEALSVVDVDVTIPTS